jgi:hypothetical protein
LDCRHVYHGNANEHFVRRALEGLQNVNVRVSAKLGFGLAHQEALPWRALKAAKQASALVVKRNVAPVHLPHKPPL